MLKPLWEGLRQNRGKALAALLKAIGSLLPLMEPEYAGHYTRQLMPTLLREYASNDDEMTRTCLLVTARAVAADGVEASYVRDAMLPDFFRHFWSRRVALDRRAHKLLLDTTVELAQKVGAGDM